MGIIRSKLTRPLKTYNVEHRAQKVINQEKPKVAPYYPSVYEQIKVAKEVNPNFMKEHYKKDSELYNRLKDVFVTSDMIENPKIERKKEKTLPFSTITPEAFEFGFWEPKEVSTGRCHLRQVIVLLADHITNKKQNSAEKLAEKYELDLKDVENLLEYYRVLQVFNKSDQEHGYREEDIGLPKMNIKGELQWKSMDSVNQSRAEDAAKEAEQKEKEKAEQKEKEKAEENKKSESPQMDKQLKDKDKETQSPEIDLKKELSKE